MQYYLTGALGVIGSCVAQYLLKQGHRVIILDAAEEPRHKLMIKHLRSNSNNVRIYQERLENSEFNELEDSDRIIHLAARTGIPSSSLFPEDDFNSNVLGTHKLLEKIRKLNRKIPLIAFSSVKPYKVDQIPYKKEGQRNIWVDSDMFDNDICGVKEDFPLFPDEPYASSKMAMSGMCMAYAQSYDLPITVFRCSNLYGPATCKGAMHGWLTYLISLHAANKEFEIQGDGFVCRDMLFTSDIISAVLLNFENMDKTQKQIFNLGGGEKNSVSILEAIDLLKEISGKNVKVRYGKGRKHEDPIFITNHSKFSNLTGWMPKVSVKEGMTNIYNWALDNKEMIKDL